MIRGIVFPTNGLELGEGHFDRVQVGAVGRQKQEPRADVLQDRGGLWAFVGGEVVPDHDVAAVQGRGQLGFDIEVEEFPVYRPANDPGRVQPVMAQCGNEGLIPTVLAPDSLGIPKAGDL